MTPRRRPYNIGGLASQIEGNHVSRLVYGVAQGRLERAGRNAERLAANSVAFPGGRDTFVEFAREIREDKKAT